jgi:hypothetical protein
MSLVERKDITGGLSLADEECAKSGAIQPLESYQGVEQRSCCCGCSLLPGKKKVGAETEAIEDLE